MQVMAADSAWAPETLVTAAGVLFALLGGIATTWATLHAAHPKRRLIYGWHISPIRDSHRGGISIRNTHRVRAYLTSSGRRDITSEMFDGQHPIRFKLAVPILGADAASTPGDARLPDHEISGTDLHIRPSKIGKGVTVTYDVLVDGYPTPDFDHSLIDVTVRRGDVSSSGMGVRTGGEAAGIGSHWRPRPAGIGIARGWAEGSTSRLLQISAYALGAVVALGLLVLFTKLGWLEIYFYSGDVSDAPWMPQNK